MPMFSSMSEPHLGKFKAMIRAGAAGRDIHDCDTDQDGDPVGEPVPEAFVEREFDRVALHRRTLVPFLERYVRRAGRILDFGCGTGGTTVAMALSRLGPERVIGVDANPRAIEAARVRGAGHGLGPPKLEFAHVPAGTRLPFDDGVFDLVSAVSVLEFISVASHREAVAKDLRRLVAPGGFLYLTTPRPAFRELHTKTWLGDLRRLRGFPWASPPWQMRAWGKPWPQIDLREYLASRMGQRLPWLPLRWVSWVSGPVLPYLAPWQKALFHRPLR